MNWVKKLTISLSIAFFAVCLGAVLLLNWSALGWKALSVPTGSMRPTITPGSLVLVHSVPNSSLRVGDVITYVGPQNAHMTITHRIIKAYKINNRIPAYITKGDANKSADPMVVVGGQVKGKEVFHVPYVGSWLTWGKGWAGLIVLIYMPALIIMLDEVKRLADYYKSIAVYRLPGFRRSEKTPKPKLAIASTLVAILTGAGLIIAPQVQALLSSNTVTLGPNTLKVGQITPPPTTCTTNSNNTTVNVNSTNTGNNNSNVNISNTTTQTSTTGNATSNGGNATTGNATNTNCTNINVNIH